MRCVNLDWLEVHCLETGGWRTAEYYKRYYVVKQREYGTPQYAEMFTLFSAGCPFLEVRRNPYSKKSQGGIFADNSCHVRLCNNACYEENCIDLLIDFCELHSLRIKGISRVDICLDFQHFDFTYPDPSELVSEYYRQKIAKINQSNIAAHGRSMWDGVMFNSTAWGSPKSNVLTKFYNKTMELREKRNKKYIRSAWMMAGLKDDCDVWRLEFSIRNVNGWLSMDGELLSHDLTRFDSRSKLLRLMYGLISVYFHFKKRVRTRDGNWQRKDRCPDVALFDTENTEIYKPIYVPESRELSRLEKMVVKFLRERKDTASIHYKMCIDEVLDLLELGELNHDHKDKRLYDLLRD